MGDEAKQILILSTGSLTRLLLALPVGEASSLRLYQATWVIQEGHGFLHNMLIPQQSLVEIDSRFSWSHVLAFWKWLRQRKPQHVFVLEVPFWMKLVVLLAGVKNRYGWSQGAWDRILFTRHFNIQKDRSHYTQLVYDLLCSSLDLIRETHHAVPPLHLEVKDTGACFEMRLTPQQYFVISPKVDTNSQGWPHSKYGELIGLISSRFPVLVLVAPEDRKVHTFYRGLAKKHSNVVVPKRSLTPSEKVDLISQSLVYVGGENDDSLLANGCKVPMIQLLQPTRRKNYERYRALGRQVKVVTPASGDDMKSIRPKDIARFTFHYL